MIKVKVSNKEIIIDPKLTIGRYQKIQKNPEKYNSPTEILALYLDLEPKELREMPVDEIVYLESVISQHNQEPNTDIVLTFTYEGVNYGMENDWGNMTWGQWSDLEVFSQKDKLEESIHILMSLLYRPILEQKGGEYTLEKFDSKKVLKRADLFRNIPIDYWFGASTFFLLLSTTYIKNMESSLKQMNQIKRIILRGMRVLPKFLIPRRLHDFILN